MDNKWYLLNFADNKYEKAQKLNTLSAKIFCKFDHIINASDMDIDTEYYNQHYEIFSETRGHGLWLWKPYLINKYLSEIKMGDILIYTDSAMFFVRDIEKAIKFTNDIWVTDLPFLEMQFTQNETFKFMGCEEEKYKLTNQISGAIIGIKKSQKSVQFVKEWLHLCEDIRILKEQNGKQDKDFIAHREDQSILSLLCKKRGIFPHKDITQYGRIPEKYSKIQKVKYTPVNHSDCYKVCLIHHRTANNHFTTCVKQLLCSFLPTFIVLKKIQSETRK